MKVSFSWLKEFVDLPENVEEISQALTLSGLEAEGVTLVEGDPVFEIGLTPNLGHCMSILGIARELSAWFSRPLHPKKVLCKESSEKTKDFISVSITDPNCHSYSCRLVKNIKVAPSPTWLKQRLEAVGLRSVNNVVDIGNYVMIALGTPLHVFDYDTLHGQKLFIKKTKTSLTTLDGELRTTEEEVLTIWDEKYPLAFAGVMGGKNSAVTEETKNVLIEAAVFSPQAVRVTSKQLKLRTDSSARFERGIDPLETVQALNLAAKLLHEIAGGAICQDPVTVVTHPYQPKLLTYRPKKVVSLLGIDLSRQEMKNLLTRLEILTVAESEEECTVQIPSYRNDMHAEIDVIEEVGRLFGFNHIIRQPPKHISSPLSHSPLFLFEEEVRAKLIAQGLQECLTCDLISPKLAALTVEKALDSSNQIHVLHPASIDQSVLRPSLLPGLLEVVGFNLNRSNLSLAAFEVGHIHFKSQDKFFEQSAAAIILTGAFSPYHFETKPASFDFLDLKGYVESFFASLSFKEISFTPSHLQNFHPGRQAAITIGTLQVGVLGEVYPRHLKDLGIDQKVFYAEINLHDLLHLRQEEQKAKKLALFPGSERDWTVLLEEKILIGPLLQQIKTLSPFILEEVFLLDLYKSEAIGNDRKNATFRFRYRDPNKTIEAKEIEREHALLIQRIEEKLANIVP